MPKEQFDEKSVKASVEALRDIYTHDFYGDPKIPAPIKSGEMGKRMFTIYCAGRWLTGKILDGGGSIEVAHKTCTALGQRSIFGNPYRWAASYANNFLEGKPLEEPGISEMELHMSKTDQLFGQEPTFIIEDPTYGKPQ